MSRYNVSFTGQSTTHTRTWITFAKDERIARISFSASTTSMNETDEPSLLFASFIPDVPGGIASPDLTDQGDTLAALFISSNEKPLHDSTGSLVTYATGHRDALLHVDFLEPIPVKRGEKLYLHGVQTPNNTPTLSAIMTVNTVD